MKNLKNVAIVLGLVLGTTGFASNIDVIRPNPTGPVYLQGSCDEALSEIAVIAPTAKPKCICEKNQCRTELTPYLSKKIQYALTVKPVFGPNCFNSVLFVKDFHNKLKNSQEMDLFILSPLCEEVVGKPKPGDIIHEYDVIKDFLIDAHSYLALTENIAFNKSGTQAEEAYEIIKTSEYMDRIKMPDECRFTGITESLQQNCKGMTVAYRCKDLSGIKEKWLHRKAKETNPMAKTLAKQALGIPDFQNFPSTVKDKIYKFTEGQFNNFDKEGKEEIIYKVFLLASPDMKVPKEKAFYDIIMEARRVGFYSKLPLEDRLMWGNVLYRGAEL